MTILNQGLYDKPQRSSSVSNKPRTVKYTGNSPYIKRVSDGENTHSKTWSVTFKGTPYQISALDLFLSDLNGTTPFRWKPDSSPSSTYTCQEWSETIDSPGCHSLSATFVQCFDVVSPLAAHTLDGSWMLDASCTLDFLLE